MISEFTSKRKLFSFPKNWANAVARWISGIHSETGTIKITNTLSPSEEGSASFDVDMEAVVGKVEKRFGFDKESPMRRDTVRDTVFDLADGASIINNGRRLSVGLDWLDEQIAQRIPAQTGQEEEEEEEEEEEQSLPSVQNLIVYQLYKPSGTSHYYAVPYTLTFTNGLLTGITSGGAYDLYSQGTPNIPTFTSGNEGS